MSFLLYLAAGVALAAVAAILSVRFHLSRARNNFDCSGGCDLLSGRTVVVTGGNTGLGFRTSSILAGLGANVVLACRDAEAGARAAEDIAAATGNAAVTSTELDLGKLDSVRSFAAALAGSSSSVDCLVCNAGVFVPMDKGLKTADGYEVHFGVNHLGHFLLAKLLLEAKKVKKVVVVSSSLLKKGRLDLDTDDFVHRGRKATSEADLVFPTGYSDSKLMNALFCMELAVRFPQVPTFSCCPGLCYTDIFRHAGASFFWMFLVPAAAFFMRSTRRGSLNIVQLVVQEKEEGVLRSGGFYKEGRLAEEERLAGMKEEAAQLWELSESLVEQHFNLQEL